MHQETTMATNLFTQPVSGTLACALGEAAAGFTGLPEFAGQELWFVVSYDPVFNPLEGQNDYAITPYTSQQDAEQNATEPGLAVFGPFSTAPVEGFNVGGDNSFNVANVYLTTQPPLPFLPSPAPPGVSIELSAGGVDAVFFSLPALEKFAVPYYAGIYGPEFAQTMLDAFSNAKVGLMVHLPWSEYVLEWQVGDIDLGTGSVQGAQPPAFIKDDVLRFYAPDGTHHHLYPPPPRR
jgi:hypothetical protein